MWFETKFEERTGRAEVVLKPEDGRIVYTIDMEQDVIERITFATKEGEGVLRFSYLQEIEQAAGEFIEPVQKSSTQGHQNRLGMLWLVRLAEGKLGQEQ
jgi:hypothetical protein